MMVNLHAARIGFLVGFFAGAIPGLVFHDSNWLGGYSSWPRRMIRLGHVSFFGIGFINLGFALTARALGLNAGLAATSTLLMTGAATMPLICYLSAWKPAFRHVFFIPAGSVILGVALFAWRIFHL